MRRPVLEPVLPNYGGRGPEDEARASGELQTGKREEPPEAPRRKAKSRSPERSGDNRTSQSGEREAEYDPDAEDGKEPFSESYDERVVPALLKKRQGGEPGQPPEEDQPPAKREQAEPLSEATMIQAEPYKSVFKMPLLELLFSRHHYLREEGLDLIAQEVSSKKYDKIFPIETEKILNGVIGIVLQIVQGKISTLVAKALTILLQALAAYKVDKKTAVLSPASVEYMLDSLLDTLGDCNALVKGKIEETLSEMVKQNMVAVNTLLAQVMKVNKKTQGKHVQRRLALLILLLKRFESEVKGMHFEDIVAYARAAVKQNNREIRLGGYHVLVEIYSIIGDKIDGYLVDLVPTQRRVLEDELKRAYGSNAVLPSTKQEQLEKEAKEELKKEKEKARADKKPDRPKKEDKKPPAKDAKTDDKPKKPKYETKKPAKPKDDEDKKQPDKEDVKKTSKDSGKKKEDKKSEPKKSSKGK